MRSRTSDAEPDIRCGAGYKRDVPGRAKETSPAKETFHGKRDISRKNALFLTLFSVSRSFRPVSPWVRAKEKVFLLRKTWKRDVFLLFSSRPRLKRRLDLRRFSKEQKRRFWLKAL